MQPVILSVLVVIAMLWLCLPAAGHNKSKDEEFRTGEENIIVA
jgi:hypothetical protein